TGTVAGVVGMVPEGLVLLTSLAFGIAAVTLARRKVLVQELPAVEGLDRVEVQPGCDESTVRAALGALANDENRNATLAAIAAAFPPPEGWARTGVIPFSSARKRSAATFGTYGTWIIGAPEMILADVPDSPAR